MSFLCVLASKLLKLSYSCWCCCYQFSTAGSFYHTAAVCSWRWKCSRLLAIISMTMMIPLVVHVVYDLKTMVIAWWLLLLWWLWCYQILIWKVFLFFLLLAWEDFQVRKNIVRSFYLILKDILLIVVASFIIAVGWFHCCMHTVACQINQCVNTSFCAVRCFFMVLRWYLPIVVIVHIIIIIITVVVNVIYTNTIHMHIDTYT